MWELRLGPTLLSPESALWGSSQRVTLDTFLDRRDFFAGAWLQVALHVGTTGNPPCVQCTRAFTEHDTRATIKAVYSVSYHFPAPTVCWCVSGGAALPG